MKSFALVMVAMLALGGSIGHAAPATQPTPKAAERARATKDAVKSFRLHLNCHGEQDKPHYHLTLSVGPVTETITSPFHLIAIITEAQAEQVIDHLAVEGFLDQAIDAANKRTSRYTVTAVSV